MNKLKVGDKVELIKWGRAGTKTMGITWPSILKDGGPFGVVESVDPTGRLTIGVRLPKDDFQYPWYIAPKYIRRANEKA